MIVKADKAAIMRAARVIRGGGLVAFPTETVYGLGADATQGRAVARIFEAKGRPRFNPLIVHVADLEAALGVAVFCEEALALAGQFLAGAAFPRSAVIGASPVSDQRTRDCGPRRRCDPGSRPSCRARASYGGAVPIAAPSANKSGRMSPTQAEHAEADFGGEVDMILDGGPSDAGLESTIVTLAPRPTLFEPGAIAREISKRFWTAVSWITAKKKCNRRASFSAIMRHEHRCGSTPWTPCPVRRFWDPVRLRLRRLSTSAQPETCAKPQPIFFYLRALDALEPSAIAVMPIPEAGLGEAINDRLRRASAPREPQA